MSKFLQSSILFLSITIFVTASFALPKTDHPLESKTTSTINLANWQQHRAYGLRNFEKIALNFMGVNAEHVRKLVVEKNYAIDKLPAIKALVAHKALDGIVILQGNKIIYEHYANGMTPQSLHSCQSTTKTMLNLLVGKSSRGWKIEP